MQTRWLLFTAFFMLWMFFSGVAAKYATLDVWPHSDIVEECAFVLIFFGGLIGLIVFAALNLAL